MKNEVVIIQTYYHVTEITNWKSIQKQGLIPMQGERAKELNEPPAVFLFPSEHDMNTALSQWLGDWFNDKEALIDQPITLISLKITLPDTFPIAQQTVPFERLSYHPIPANYIHFYKTE